MASGASDRELQELKQRNYASARKVQEQQRQIDDLLQENRLLTQSAGRKRLRASNVRTDHNGIACGINMLFFFSCRCASGRSL